MDNSRLPVGFFDSGMGGAGVLKEAMKILPDEDYIYYGDNANIPYGDKTPAEIEALTERGVSILAQKGIKALVIACNTATSVAVEHIRCSFDFPVIGIEPAIRPALASVSGKVLVMATAATISLPKFQALVRRLHGNRRIIKMPCPGLADLVDKDASESEILAYLERTISEHKDAEAVVLGCTHYVMIADTIAKFFGPDMRLFNGNKGTALQLQRELIKYGLLNNGSGGKVEFFSSDPDPKVRERFLRLLDMQR